MVSRETPEKEIDLVQPAPAQFNSTLAGNQLSNLKAKFANADRICVSGMWALYNSTDYGRGAEDSTTVISVRGTDINTCTQSGQIPVLKSIQSVHYLGSADYAEDGLLIYSQPYLLGALWNHTQTPDLPTGINGFPLASLAITGRSAWVICEDNDTPCTNGVCVNLKSYANIFLQRNTARDTSLPNGWPRIVRRVQIDSVDECSFYPNPAPLYNQRVVKKSVVEVVDGEPAKIDISNVTAS